MNPLEKLIKLFESELPKTGSENQVTLFANFISRVMDSMLGKRSILEDRTTCLLYAHCLDYMQTTQDECFSSLWEYFAQNERLAQFFTPSEVCGVMGQIVLDGVDWDGYSERYPLVIGEPTAGGGRTLVGVLKLVPDGCMHKVLVHATELDRNVAMCCALNLLHYNVNGFVIQGDVISQRPQLVYRIRHDPWRGGEISEITDEKNMKAIMSMALENNKNKEP